MPSIFTPNEYISATGNVMIRRVIYPERTQPVWVISVPEHATIPCPDIDSAMEVAEVLDVAVAKLKIKEESFNEAKANFKSLIWEVIDKADNLMKSSARTKKTPA